MQQLCSRSRPNREVIEGQNDIMQQARTGEKMVDHESASILCVVHNRMIVDFDRKCQITSESDEVPAVR